MVFKGQMRKTVKIRNEKLEMKNEEREGRMGKKEIFCFNGIVICSTS